MTLYQNVKTAMSPRFDASASERQPLTCGCHRRVYGLLLQLCRCKSCMLCVSEDCIAKVASNHSLDRCNTIKQLSKDIRRIAKSLRREQPSYILTEIFRGGFDRPGSEQLQRDVKDYLVKRETLIKELIREGFREGGTTGIKNELALDIAVTQSNDMVFLGCNTNVLFNSYLVTGRLQCLYDLSCFLCSE